MSAEMTLPDEWIVTEIDALGEIVTGKTPPTKEIENFGGIIPFIKPGDLDQGGIISNTVETLTEKGLLKVPQLPKDSIMVTCIGNLGKVGITKCVSATNQQINSIICNENVFHKFIYYRFLFLKDWLDQQSSATTVSIINKSRFSKAPVCLAPLAEQHQIAQRPVS